MSLACGTAPRACRLNAYAPAFADATRAVDLDPAYSNGYKRRAQAGVGLGDKESLESAVRDFTKVRGPGCVSSVILLELSSPHLPVVQAVELGDKDLAGPLKEAKAALKKARRKDYYAVRTRSTHTLPLRVITCARCALRPLRSWGSLRRPLRRTRMRCGRPTTRYAGLPPAGVHSTKAYSFPLLPLTRPR